MNTPPGTRVVRFVLGCAVLAHAGVSQAGDGRLFGRRHSPPPTRYVATQATLVPGPTPRLGTFYQTPYMTVGGNGFEGGAGFTPLSQYGNLTLSMYGPFSSLRSTAAPMTLVTRGYDGSFRADVGTTSSYPFLPAASPVIYPTRAQVRGSYPFQSTPPWWDTGFGWVDQN